MIKRIVELLDKQGPLTGKELYDKIPLDELSLWQSCNKSKKIILKQLEKDCQKIEDKAKLLYDEIINISRQKLKLT